MVDPRRAAHRGFVRRPAQAAGEPDRRRPLPLLDGGRGGVIPYAVMLLIVLAIAGFDRRPARVSSPALVAARARAGALRVRRPLRRARRCSSRCSTAARSRASTPNSWQPEPRGCLRRELRRDRAGRADRRGADLPRARLLAARAVRDADSRSSRRRRLRRSATASSQGFPELDALRLRPRLAPRRGRGSVFPGMARCTRCSTESRSLRRSWPKLRGRGEPPSSSRGRSRGRAAAEAGRPCPVDGLGVAAKRRSASRSTRAARRRLPLALRRRHDRSRAGP